MTVARAVSSNPAPKLTKRQRFSVWFSDHGAAISGLVVFLGLAALDYFFILPLILAPSDKDTATIVAAAITVNGAFLAAAVTYTGLVFKRQSDRRSEALAVQTSQLAKQEAGRLQTEAAMKAVGLLATSDGKTAPEFQASALLIVLDQLGYLELALDLAAELWPNSGITRTSAIELINRGLTNPDTNIQLVAAKLLKSNVQRLVETRSVTLPTGEVASQVVRFWPEVIGAGAPESLGSEAKNLVSEAEAEAARYEAVEAALLTAKKSALPGTVSGD